MRSVINECDISISVLRECFDADFVKGTLAWKHRPASHFNTVHGQRAFSSTYVGKKGGCPDANGHIRVRISIKGKTGTFFIHRILWALRNGAWPETQIDHRNTIKSDNSFTNLRKATNAQNMANRGLQSNSTSGATGVHFLKRTGRFQAYVKHHGKRIHLGYYSTFDEAKTVRDAAAEKLFGEFHYVGPR